MEVTLPTLAKNPFDPKRYARTLPARSPTNEPANHYKTFPQVLKAQKNQCQTARQLPPPPSLFIFPPQLNKGADAWKPTQTNTPQQSPE
jgi:hypothetical protein